MDRTLPKTCSKCKILKTLFDFPLNKKNKDGHGYYCDTCQKVAVAASKAKVPTDVRSQRSKEETERRKAKTIASNPYADEKLASLKQCNKCDETKAKSEFPRCIKSVDGFHGSCKLCKNALEKEFEYYTEENRKKYYINHITKYPENEEKLKESSRLWKVNNPGKRTAQSRLRAIKKKNAVPSWANLQTITEIYELRTMMSRRDGVTYHVDHDVPLVSEVVCGLHVEHNLKIRLNTINLSKGNKFDPWTYEWWPDSN